MKKILGEVIKNKIFIYIMCITLVGLAGFVVVKSFNKKEVVSIKKCVITFDTNGGTNISSTEIDCGQKIQKPEIQPEKDGFEFIGWTYNDEIYEFDKEINEDIILVASYEKKEGTEVVTITFNSNGGTPIKPIEIVSGTILKNKPFNPTKSGYEFIGWYLEDSLFDFNKKIDDNITLLAQWKKVVSKSLTGNENNNDNSDNNYNNITKCENYKFNGEVIDSKTGYYAKEIPYDVCILDGNLWEYDSDACKIVHRTNNSKLVNSSGHGCFTFNDYGKATLYSCMVDKSSNKELKCYTEEVEVMNYTLPKVPLDYSSIEGRWYANYSNVHGIEFSGYTRDDRAEYISYMLLGMSSNLEYACSSGKCTDESFTTSGEGNSAIYSEFYATYSPRVENGFLYLTKNGKTVKFSRKPYDIKLNSVEIDDAYKVYDNIILGSEICIGAYSKPRNANDNRIEWTLSNDNIVIKNIEQKCLNNKAPYFCDNSYICFIGNKIGKTTITAKSKTYSYSDSLTLEVIEDPTYHEIEVKSISITPRNISIYRGEVYNLTATLTPSNATNNAVSWSSSNTSVATVSSSGKVTAVGVGTAVVTATTEDGNHIATCEVTVEKKPLNATGSIGLITAFSNNAIVSGVEVKINATGGSEKYTYYYIKLYKNGSLIYESTDTTKSSVIISGNKNGSYNAEFIVKDSDGNEYHGTIPTTTIST